MATTGKGVPRIRDMSPRQLEHYENSLAVLSRMRRHRISREVAARDFAMDPRTVQRWVGGALQRVGRQWAAKPRDQLERQLRLYDERGSYFITVEGSTRATRISDYHNAVDRFIHHGDASKLREFEGKSVADVDGRRHRFLTDPQAIRKLARARVFGFDSIY